MTAKEKANELVGKYEHHSKPMEYGINFSGDIDHAIESALICVDEFIDALSFNSSPTAEGLTEFYEKVKQEINKL